MTLKEALEGLHYTEGEEDTVEKQFGGMLRSCGKTVATAESCTGGYIAHLITSVAGCSEYYKGGVVAYTNEMKVNFLGVDAADIEQFGAVSEPVVRQMADGVMKLTGADYAIATTGVAGPGPDGGKPAGLVYIGVSFPEIPAVSIESSRYAVELNLQGSREVIRHKTIGCVLENLREFSGSSQE